MVWLFLVVVVAQKCRGVMDGKAEMAVVRSSIDVNLANAYPTWKAGRQWRAPHGKHGTLDYTL